MNSLSKISRVLPGLVLTLYAATLPSTADSQAALQAGSQAATQSSSNAATQEDSNAATQHSSQAVTRSSTSANTSSSSQASLHAPAPINKGRAGTYRRPRAVIRTWNTKSH